jgi:hypothetical protein
MSKINKALDLNKLFIEHKKGKLLKKHPKFPMYAGIKWDGNYATVIVDGQGLPIFTTSGGHVYDHNKPTIFETAPIGFVYIVERIGTDGKLGDRVNCNLKGPRGMQTSYGHSYKIHDMIKLSDYDRGISGEAYMHRRERLHKSFEEQHIALDELVHNMEELNTLLNKAVRNGYEGVMGKCPHWLWKSTKSRTVDILKYKKRPTVDLLCIGVNEGTKKYEGLIGSLRLKDSKGRIVDVGSGMSDEQRYLNPSYFIGKVVEVFYEQILDTYIQPTFGDEYEGVLVRDDKTAEDID